MTGELLLLGRVALSAVFAIAGVTKLASMSSTRESVVAFGVSQALAAPFAVALILCELALAIALIPPATAWYGAIGATTLLLVFCLAIAANLLRGKRPACNCFGQLHATEIGWPTFVRDAVLAAIALLIVVDRNDANVSLLAAIESLGPDRAFALAASVIVIVLLLAIASLMSQVLKQQGRMVLRFEEIERHLGIAPPEPEYGLQPGTPAPAFELPLLAGGTASLASLLEPHKRLLLVFTNPACGPCLSLVPSLARWQRDLRDSLTIALLSEGTREDNDRKFANAGLSYVLLQHERDTAELYSANATPAAVLVTPDGRIAAPVAHGADAIRLLVGAQNVSPGDEVPDLKLKTLDEKEFGLRDLRGSSALLVFWDQHCGYCRQMIPDLKSWYAKAGADSPRMFFVSSNTPQEFESFDVDATVLLDPESLATETFGVRGTPMGISIDSEGRIASPLVAGAKEILALAGSNGHGSLV